jgi:hypothetical protein
MIETADVEPNVGIVHRAKVRVGFSIGWVPAEIRQCF